MESENGRKEKFPSRVVELTASITTAIHTLSISFDGVVSCLIMGNKYLT